MRPLSISTAWNETAAFVKREAGLLFPIALAFLALPSIVAQYLMPAVEPGQQPELGGWVFLLIPLIVLSTIGTLAVSSLALRPAQTVGSAISHGARRLLPTLGAFVVLALLTAVLLVPIAILIALLGLDERRTVALSLILFVFVFSYFWIRFLMISPSAVTERLGPVGLLKQSWQLTRGHFVKLIGFVSLLSIVFVVALMAVTLVVGTIATVLAGPPEPGSLSYLISLVVTGILGAIFSVYLSVSVARIYAQLSEGASRGS